MVGIIQWGLGLWGYRAGAWAVWVSLGAWG